MSILTETIELLRGSWIPEIYTEKVRTQRTRAYEMDIPMRENSAEILFTLLGIELKVGKKRFSCPDLGTARYLRVFARIGCSSVAIPYNITKISVLADEFEVAWHQLILAHNELAGKFSPAALGRSRSAVLKVIRSEMITAGSGPAMPEFKTSTRQRDT